MFRQVLAILLSCVVMFAATDSALAATPEERTRKLAEKVSSIPEGSIVEVKTTDRQQLKGRIGQITETGFSVQTARNEKVETVAVEYKNTKSVKVVAMKDDHQQSGKSTAGWVLMGGLAALGTILVVAIAVALASSN